MFYDEEIHVGGLDKWLMSTPVRTPWLRWCKKSEEEWAIWILLRGAWALWPTERYWAADALKFCGLCGFEEVWIGSRRNQYVVTVHVYLLQSCGESTCVCPCEARLRRQNAPHNCWSWTWWKKWMSLMERMQQRGHRSWTSRCIGLINYVWLPPAHPGLLWR